MLYEQVRREISETNVSAFPADRIKWISLFNTLRNNWAHEGTKEKGLNSNDVELLGKIHAKLGLNHT